MQPHSHSISITVHKRMAVAVVGFGLLLVATMSTFMAVWAFDWNTHNELLTTGESYTTRTPSDGATLSNFTVPLARDVHESEPRTKTKARAHGAKAPRSKGPKAPGAGVVEPSPAGPPTPTEEPPDEDEDEVSVSPSAPRPTSREAPRLEPPNHAEPAPPPRTPSTRRRKKATVRVSGVPAAIGYQVKIASSLLTMPSKLVVTTKMSAGRKKVQWRQSQDAPWTTSDSLMLRPGEQRRLILTSRGPRSPR